jgi:TolB protein
VLRIALALLAIGLLCGATGAVVSFAAGSNPSQGATQPAQAEPIAAGTPTVAALAPPAPVASGAQWGTLVLDARAGGWEHLWVYAPGRSGATPIVAGEWNDRHPAASPDGRSLAFASDRDGAWDIYVLDLTSNTVRRITDTAAYEGWPTWSPDGRWLAVESYADGDLDIWVLSIDGSSPPIQLTNEIGADTSPAWDPQGRRIAFISDRSGQPDLYLADLDVADTGRFRNLTETETADERDPAFDPGGGWLAYSASQQGMDQLKVMNLAPGGRAAEIGQGVAPTWSPDGSVLLTSIRGGNRRWSAAYPVGANAVMPPGLPTIAVGQRAAWLPDGAVPPELNAGSILPTGTAATNGEPEALRTAELVVLSGVQPSGTKLLSEAALAFGALRLQAAAQAGWDFLSRLETAFVGINDPLPPGWQVENWLETGRAFSLAVEAYRSGWIEIVREDIGAETYWRVFLRTAQQDGSAGEPLRHRPWDLDARYRGDAPLYDQGGAPKSVIPSGYYLDLTALAAELGFERLPALANWRRYYPGARFNEFVLRQGLTWEEAMLELYPPAAISTPTPFRTPTLSPTPTLRPTRTPSWWRWRTPTPSPFPTLAPTATLPTFP